MLFNFSLLILIIDQLFSLTFFILNYVNYTGQNLFVTHFLYKKKKTKIQVIKQAWEDYANEV